MIGSAGAVVTNGLGAFVGDQNHLITLGYGNGAAAVVIPPPVRVNLGGGGRVLSWEEAVLEEHKKRLLEERIRKYGSELKQVQKKIKKVEVAAQKAGRSEPKKVDGILANLWKLEERKEELKNQVVQLKQEVVDIQTLLIAAQKQKDYEEDEEDIEMLLLQ